MIRLNQLREAKDELTDGGEAFDPRGWDIGRVSISARLRSVEIDPESAALFARELVERDQDRLLLFHLLYNKYQFRVLEAALMAGMALGAKAKQLQADKVI